jgi:elongation factor G
MYGAYQTDENGNEQITGDLELQHFPLRVINPFVPDKMVRFTGDVDGTLSMTGSPMQPVLNGGLQLDSVLMIMPEMSVGFRFDNKQVKMQDSRMMFDKFNIYTRGETPFVINGSVDFSDMEKMMAIVNRMREEDPTLCVEQSKELRQVILHGQGEFHLRTFKWCIENNDKLMINFEEPKIPYRETITKAARADYRHKKQSGGAGQFGEVHLILEPYEEGKPLPEMFKFGNQEFKVTVKGVDEYPLDWGGKLIFVNSIVGGSIDARFMPAILKGIMQRIEQGPLTGSYARDVRVIVYDGKMHPVDSNEISFLLAGRNAFSAAFKEAGPKILEPIYDVEVLVPAEFMGDVMSDLQGRRGMIMGMETEGSYQVLKAKVPLKEMSTYSTSLSSITGGSGSFVMSFADYELVPTDVQDKLIKEFEANQKDED